MNTVAVESARGWGIAKEKTSKKIDANVALPMASVAALENKPKLIDPHEAPMGFEGGEFQLRDAEIGYL